MPDLPARKVAIFVSSPSDVMAERERAARVIDRLQSRFRDHVTFAPVFFEEKYFTADRSPQAQIPDAAATDLVISVFWSRLGSELAPDIFGTMPDGQPYPGGAVYELMRALEAKRQKNTPDILVYRKTAQTGISVTDADQRRLMTAQLDAFEAFWRQWFVSREGHFRAGFQTFNSADEFERLLENHLRIWLDEQGLLGTEVIWRIPERGSPFRGLAPYEMRHAEVFFGRDREIDRGRQRLLAAAAGGTAFLLIMGPSGSGKSSLARAGLVSRLTRPSDVDGIDVTRVAVMRPGEAATPQRALAEALFAAQALPELVDSDFPEPELLSAALMGEASAATAPILRALARVATRLKASKDYDRPVEARLLLVIDQLEELLAGTVTEPARLAFVRLLAELARCGLVYVIATLRSSSYGALAREPELVALKDAGATLDVAVPGPEVLAEIVRRPAMAAGLVFDRREERGLDEALLKAAGGNADALPLLGFTLQWLFEHRDCQRLTYAAYDQLGGLEGAIGRTAEQAFAELDQGTQAALPQLLRGLAQAPRTGAGLVLRDMPLSDAPEGTQLRTVADALVAARVLLVHGVGQGAMLRLAHDAVLRGWERARDIVAKEQDFFRIREEVTAAEERWHERGRNDLLLAPGLPLAEAQLLRNSYGAELAPNLVAYIDASTKREQWRQRRGYTLAAVFGLVAIVAIGSGVFAWYAQRSATLEAARAARNFNAAKSAIDSVVFDLAQGLERVEGMRAETVRQILTRAEGAIGRLAAGTENEAQVRRSQAAMYGLFSQTYLSLGATKLAIDYAHKSLEIFRTLAANDPATPNRRLDLATGLERLGEARQSQGDLAGALTAYREGLSFNRELVARDPNNPSWLHGLAVNLFKVGETLKDQGDLAGALAAHRESYDVLRRLAAKAPDNLRAQRDMTVGLTSVADVLMIQGDLGGALASYRESLDIRRALSAKEPDNTEIRRDVTLSLEKMGELLSAQGDLTGALAAQREALATRRVLFAKDPGNTGWRRDVTVSLIKVGDLLVDQGDLGGAFAVARESLSIRRELAAQDPGNTGWRSDEASSIEKLGNVLKLQGNLAGALKAQREALTIRRELSAKDPGNAAWRRDVSVSLNKVGNLLVEQGASAPALAAFREALDIRRQLSAKDPSNTRWRTDLAFSLQNVGDALLDRTDIDGALAAYRESVAITRELLAKDAGNTEWRRNVGIALSRLGNGLLAKGDGAGALAAYREDIDISRALAAKDPSNTDWLRGLFVGLIKLGDAQDDQNDKPGALIANRESVEVARKLVARDLHNTQWQRDLSVSLDRLGEGLTSKGDVPAALATARESLAITRALAAKDPDNPTWQRDLTVSLEKLGDVLAAKKDLAGALVAYRESQEIRGALAAKAPNNAGWQRDFSIAINKVGDTLRDQNDMAGALAAYRQSLDIRRALLAKAPKGAQQRRDVQFDIGRIGGLAYRLVLVGDFADALEAADQAIALDPDKLWMATNRAHALMFLGRVDEARDLYLRYRGTAKVQGDKPWETVILNDFAEIRKAGLSHPLMDEIEKRFSAGG